MPININTLVNQEKRDFNVYYRKLLKSHLLNDELSKAIIYGSMNGGKRIRPFIISVFAKIAKIKKNNYLRLSASVESIHSYSLIHDDLPSMDDDDYRRGKLSVHKKFNEAKAILAGDALHDLAFEILSDKKTHKKSDVRINLVEKLSKKLGSKGLAGGQSLDLLFENNSVTVNQILKMYLMKTSALFSYCCVAPFLCAEKNKKDIKFAEEFGNLYGLIFQILDDINDETENFLFLGKTPGKDKRQGKSTFVSSVDKERAIIFCNKKIRKFIKSNNKYFIKWKVLEKILFNDLNEYL
jgi:geranylgeranyl pyrophosphate synthase